LSEADPATAVPLDSVKHVVQARPRGQASQFSSKVLLQRLPPLLGATL
jgi:hypothetical protein